MATSGRARTHLSEARISHSSHFFSHTRRRFVYNNALFNTSLSLVHAPSAAGRRLLTPKRVRVRRNENYITLAYTHTPNVSHSYTVLLYEHRRVRASATTKRSRDRQESTLASHTFSFVFARAHVRLARQRNTPIKGTAIARYHRLFFNTHSSWPGDSR